MSKEKLSSVKVVHSIEKNILPQCNGKELFKNQSQNNLTKYLQAYYGHSVKKAISEKRCRVWLAITEWKVGYIFALKRSVTVGI